jgi:hypothetical protein
LIFFMVILPPGARHQELNSWCLAPYTNWRRMRDSSSFSLPGPPIFSSSPSTN